MTRCRCCWKTLSARIGDFDRLDKIENEVFKKKWYEMDDNTNIACASGNDDGADERFLEGAWKYRP